MIRTRVLFAAVAALVAGTGCNAVLGAGEPEIGNGLDVVDLDPAGAPGACGDGVINVELGESCDDENTDTDDGCVKCKIVCGPFPEVLDENTGHCYRFGSVPATMPDSMSNPVAMQDKLPWSAAEAACTTWKGEFASITPTPIEGSPQVTYDELAFVQNVVMHESDKPDGPNESVFSDGIWLGAKRAGTAFAWETGEVLENDDLAWSPNDPKEGDCVALGNDSLAFESLDCKMARAYLCERGVPGQVVVAEETGTE